jgi:pimeloyl-ACP methyl ester carboxylesterase
MKNSTFTTIYKNVPHEQTEKLRRFRSSHPYMTCIVDNTKWEYISCGKGRKTLLLLPGGIRFADTWFKLITALEDKYRIISPTYPALPTIAELTRGIFTILKSEHVDEVQVLGTSFGGWVAQYFVRHYPDAVKTLILSNTSRPDTISSALIRISQVFTSIYPERLLQSAFKKRLLSLFSGSDREFWEAYLEEVSVNTKRADIKAQQKCTYDMTTYTFSENDLNNWHGRILILESDDDPAFKELEREALKALYPQAYVHTFHNAGHTPGYTGPEEYISVLENFLNGAGE